MMLATNMVQNPKVMSMNLGTEMLVLCVPWFLAPGFTHGVPQVFHRNITLATKQIKSAKKRKIWRTVGTLLGNATGNCQQGSQAQNDFTAAGWRASSGMGARPCAREHRGRASAQVARPARLGRKTGRFGGGLVLLRGPG